MNQAFDIIDERHTKLIKNLQAAIAMSDGELSAIELLAVTAQVCGQLLAVQDPNLRSGPEVMTIVQSNMQIGNQVMVDRLFGQTQGNA